jgi:predicted SnoaL-like aldol condensation-catalyzing enzyme
MLFLSSTIALLAGLSSLAAAHPTTRQYCPPQPVSSAERAIIFDAYVQTFYFKNITLAMNTYVAENLTQHNPNIPNGRDAQTAAVIPIYASSNFELKNVLMDGDYGMIYNRVSDKSNASSYTDVVDIYRFEGSCLVEHWDILQDSA